MWFEPKLDMVRDFCCCLLVGIKVKLIKQRMEVLSCNVNSMYGFPQCALFDELSIDSKRR